MPRFGRAVVTVCVGAEAEAMLAVTRPYLEHYARRCRADLVVLTDYAGPPGWPMGAKFGVARVLDYYEVVAYLDADVLPRPGCVNVFDVCGPGVFGACDELPFHQLQPQHGLEVNHAQFRAKMGFPVRVLPWYVNAGVMVVPRSHRSIIEPPARLFVPRKGMGRHCAEQHLVNARLLESGLPYRLLDRRCNWQNWCPGFDTAPPDALLHWSGSRKGRPGAIAAAAEKSPLPASFAPPAALYPEILPFSIDPTHAAMIHAELATGDYGRVLEVGCYKGFSTTAILAARRTGYVGEVHLCDPAVTPELKAAVAYYTGDMPHPRVTIHEEPSTSLLARDVSFDFAFLDGDHSAAAVEFEVRALAAAGCRCIMAHDVSPAAHEVYGTDTGPRLAEPLLRDLGYHVTVDDTPRSGERTERGLLKAIRKVKPLPPVRLSIVVATTGRDTLARTLRTVAEQGRPGDELIVEFDDTGDMAATPRTTGMRKAAGTHLLFMDDDDIYVPGALDIVRDRCAQFPGRCLMFTMTSGDNGGWRLPDDSHEVRPGNVSTCMFVCPNDPDKLGRWGPRREGDYEFIASTVAHYGGKPVWLDAHIAARRPY